jgi:uncharacterized protein
MPLADERYLAFTTYRKDGRAVTTPVWSIDLGDNRIGFWTSSGSGKAKRLAHTSRVTVQAADSRGRPKPGTEPVEATATLVTGEELEQIRQKVVAKYGFQTKLTKFIQQIVTTVRGKKIPYGDRGVVVTLP